MTHTYRSSAVLDQSSAGVRDKELRWVPDHESGCEQPPGLEPEPGQEDRDPVPSRQSHPTGLHVGFYTLYIHT